MNTDKTKTFVFVLSVFIGVHQRPISLRADAKIISQIGLNCVVPSRNDSARGEAEGRDQLWFGFEMGWILVSVEIGGHDQASLGAGGADEFEHFFVAVQGLGSPVFGDLGEQSVLDGIPFGSTGRDWSWWRPACG